MSEQLRCILATCLPEDDVTLTPLEGGLDHCGLFRVAAGGRHFVLKLLRDTGLRELAVYNALTGTAAGSAVPVVYGAGVYGEGEAYLCLEYLEACSRWPWADAEASVAVLEQLARVHRLPVDPQLAGTLTGYETDLTASARDTLEFFASTIYSGMPLGDRPMVKSLERVVEMLPAMRVALAAWHEPVLLHGDAHSGNAIVQRRGDAYRAILLDWGRSRIGSPLEDVSSWLQSLGFWEPEVRRRHDTLLRCYLEAAGLTDRLDPELRQLYWIAAASNAMAGALRYHLAVLLDDRRSRDERSSAASSLKDWLRIIRRADACWRN